MNNLFYFDYLLNHCHGTQIVCKGIHSVKTPPMEQTELYSNFYKSILIIFHGMTIVPLICNFLPLARFTV